MLLKTLGVPLFQEQAMRLAMVAANFTDHELNELRHAMATFRRRGKIHLFEEKMVTRMVARGYDEEFAKRCFDQIKGFGEYGFPESHSASFAHLAYVSAWLKCHHPDVFACGLLNSQPMGFYAAAQIVRDAREHGVKVLPVDINFSDRDNTLEATPRGRFALRLGFRQVDGVGKAPAQAIVDARIGHYRDIEEVQARSGASVAILEKLADGDAFRSAGLDRRQALWNVRALTRSPGLPLFDHAQARDQGPDPDVDLPDMSLPEHVVADYQTLRLSLKAHPMEFLRARFSAEGAVTAQSLRTMKDGARVKIAGLVLVRQRPGTAKGVIFMTIEDETGVANAVVWAKTFEAYRKTVMASRLVLLRGRIQSHEKVIHVVVDRLENHNDRLYRLSEHHLDPPVMPTDEVARPRPETVLRRHPRNVQIMPKSRDFH